MYQAFLYLWRRDTVPRIGQISSYERFEKPERGVLEGVLPERYVAVRFYFNFSFPDDEQNRAFVAATLRSLLAQTDVVLLNTGIAVDDHVDFGGMEAGRIYRLDQLMTPQNNLYLQTVAIAHASGFVGTYGGLSYLPPFLGVPSACYYAHPERFSVAHLERAQRIFQGDGWGDFVALNARGNALVDLLAAATSQPAAALEAR
jgi:hypothetical protein